MLYHGKIENFLTYYFKDNSSSSYIHIFEYSTQIYDKQGRDYFFKQLRKVTTPDAKMVHDLVAQELCS